MIDFVEDIYRIGASILLLILLVRLILKNRQWKKEWAENDQQRKKKWDKEDQQMKKQMKNLCNKDKYI